ncbi:hypothetical protein EV122DRAFT_286336 [Schizophyllum commune]
MSAPTSAWPADSRAESSTSRRNGKRKQTGTHIEGYPTIVPGLLSSATLLERPNGRLEWSSIIGATNKRKRPRVTAKGPLTLFPPTRTPDLPLPHTTIQQKAEESANFLRTFLPDVDVTAELIREEITHDEGLARDTVAFDPLAGNILAPLVYYGSSDQATACLAFPTGELGSDLNISPYAHDADEGTIFLPNALPARTFPTPIQHIVAHNPASGIWNQASYLAVRTLGATHISQLKTQPSTSAVKLDDCLALKRAHTGGKYIVDMKFQPSGPTFVAVNEQGAVYSADLSAAPSSLKTVVKPLDSSSQNDQFWRLDLNPSTSTFLLASSSVVRRIDPRLLEPSAPIFSLAKPPERITTIEDDPDENVIRLCTTTQLLWLDSRFSTRPLLSYVHGRQYDPSLQLHTARLRGTPLSFLSSPHNGLVTVYDVSRADEDLIYVHTPPYAHTSIPEQPFVGQTLFRHPSLNDDSSTLSCIRLDAQGRVTCNDLYLGNEGEGETSRTSVRWSDEVKGLASVAESAEPDSGPLGMQDKVEMNLRPAYDRVFRQYDDERRTAQEQDTESVYDLLDNVPNYWQQADEYPDHILTTYDVLFRSGDEPKNPSRADFLTQSTINSLRGYRALVQDRIPLHSIRKGAKWHWDMESSLARLDSDFDSMDVQGMEEQLKRWNLAGEDRAVREGNEAQTDSPEDRRPAASLRRETEARQQLTLDLALSRHVFSARPFVPPPEESDDLEAMTSALSLATDPPPVHFSYLAPLRKDHYGREGAGAAADSANNTSDPNTSVEAANTTVDNADNFDQPLTLPPGPRLLLSEWTLGEDSSEYEFHDAYDADSAERPPPVKRKAAKPTSTAGILSAELQQRSQPPPVMASQPPPVVASQRPPAIFAQRPPAFGFTQPPARRPLQAAGSEPNMDLGHNRMDVGQSQPNAEFSQSQSQGMDFMPSTQVLPGPFGGRPAPKKKPAKKRVGGF